MNRRSLVALLLVLAACTDGGGPKPSPTPTPHRGGEAVFGYELGAECLNPITECASADYAHRLLFHQILPGAMRLDARGNFVASPLLVAAPSLDNGGLTQNPFTVRFRIAPAAVWENGSPITSADFAFTWRAILNTNYRGVAVAYRVSTYRHVLAVDAQDPNTAIVRLDGLYVDWPDLFGGVYDYVLKAAAFPKADPRAPNLRKEMLDSIPFSGGPFRLESWTPDRTVLVRNDRYFGQKALLDRVTFLRLLPNEDPFDVLIRGKIYAIDPGAGDWAAPLGQRPPRLRNIGILGGDGTIFEALWINQHPPLDDPRVREALMYAIDRQGLIDGLVKDWDSRAQVLDCGLVALPNLGPWCRTRPFARFTYDPGRARSILVDDGYDCSGAICGKNGEPLETSYYVDENNAYRLRAAQLLIGPARAAGFLLELRTYSPHFSGSLQPPLLQSALVAAADPSVTEILGCAPRGPTHGGHFAGWCDPEANRLMREADRELDPSRRLELMQQIYELEAANFISLPLYVIPAVTAWRSDKIAGPIGAYNSSPYGTFFNMNEWYLAS